MVQLTAAEAAEVVRCMRLVTFPKGTVLFREGDERSSSYMLLVLEGEVSVDAGEGDIVIVVQEGWSASTAATGKAGAAIDSAIVGVVDYIDLLPDEK